MQESPRTKPSGPFNLVQDFIEDIEKDWVQSDKWQRGKTLEVNSDFLHSPLRSADVNGVSYPADRLQRLISNAPSHLVPTGTRPLNYNTIGSPSAYNINDDTSPTRMQKYVLKIYKKSTFSPFFASNGYYYQCFSICLK